MAGNADLRTLAAFGVILGLAACATQLPPPSRDVRYGAAIRDAVEHFRQSFNAARCDLIYSEASPQFRDLESRKDWDGVCDSLRGRFGPWVSFDLRSTDVWQSFFGHAVGTAVWANGSGSFRLGFSLENFRPRLFSVALEGLGQPVVIPVPRGPGLWKFANPPPPKPVPRTPAAGIQSARALFVEPPDRLEL